MIARAGAYIATRSATPFIVSNIIPFSSTRKKYCSKRPSFNATAPRKPIRNKHVTSKSIKCEWENFFHHDCACWASAFVRSPTPRKSDFLISVAIRPLTSSATIRSPSRTTFSSC